MTEDVNESILLSFASDEKYSWTPSYQHGPSDLEGCPAKEISQRAQPYLDDSPNCHLCITCRTIFSGVRVQKSLGARAEADLKQNLAELQTSAAQGCQLCWLRWTQTESHHHLLSQSQNTRYGYWESRVGNGIAFDYPYLDSNQKPLTLSVGLSPIDEAEWTSNISALRCLERDGQGFKASNLHDVQSSSNSFISFVVIKMWMQDCLGNHALCKESVMPDRFLPTRLVDLGGNNTIQPKICLGRDLPIDTPYVSLSHCWGGISIMRLLKSNFAAFKKGMAVDELPRTFRDAMELTKRVGVQYIWIDSLCIIQDSPEDWTSEAARMGQVYNFALFNIAATRAKNGVVGCFAQRSLTQVEPCRVDSTWNGLRATSYFCHDFKMLERNLDQAPLLERAWVVQELALAPRVVHFAQSQIFWECLERRACESFPAHIPNSSAMKLGLTAASLKSNIISYSPQMWRAALWSQLVQRYSEANLTFPTKDKFVAISGLARILIPQDQYVAGHIKAHLLEDLQWTADPSKDYRIKRRVQGRAPSWSWASIDGPVFLRNHQKQSEDKRYDVELLEVFIQLTTDDPYGPVQRAHLRLKGLVVCVGLSTDVVVTGRDLRLRNGGLDTSRPGDNEGAPLSRFEWRVFLDEGRRQTGEQIHCLIFSLGDAVATGLLLDPTKRKGEYTRSGYFSVSLGDDYRRRIEDWVRMKPSLEVGRVFENHRFDFQELFQHTSIQIGDVPDLYEGEVEKAEDGLLRHTVTIV